MVIGGLNEALRAMWDHCIQSTHLIVSPTAERALMRILFPSLPIARTSKMRRLRKLKYRRRP